MKIKLHGFKNFVNMFFSASDFTNGSIAGWLFKNRHKHFFGTMLIGAVLMHLLIRISGWYNVNAGTYAASILAITFFGWFINAVVEHLQDMRSFKVDGINIFDWGDVRWGTYGAFVGSLLSLFLTLKYFG